MCDQCFNRASYRIILHELRERAKRVNEVSEMVVIFTCKKSSPARIGVVGNPSVCLSVCLSRVFCLQDFTKTNITFEPFDQSL